ncbi:hypothetical protein MMYC01_200955 [Madurella mycetomatis]|uniref:Siderophore biosynthesis n=1 Tax=Madurella mycetomatis TaxID=100816 RepID=A0A175WEF4_9PEZI|nr:hypothetical protein MMYC01_205663 [Madurella mycetomatis]KXX82147.1 hypothetical protein MMYC01_200955 [Madurella mycetomatis]
MAPAITKLLGAAALLSVPAAARTNLAGCVSTEVPYMTKYVSLLWYDPDTGEICEFLDCGGGRAPPKTTVPGCPLYSGTETVTPSFWEGFTKTAEDEAVSTTDASEVQSTTAATTAKTTGTTIEESSESAEVTEAPEPVSTSEVSASASEEVGGGDQRETEQARTTIMTVTNAVDVPGGPASTAAGSVESSTLSTAGAVPTGAVAKGLGLVAGAAAAGLVFV